MLSIRKFVEDRDEAIWIQIHNATQADLKDYRPLTMQDISLEKGAPDWDSSGLFVAEWSSTPVGMILAYVDKFREEKRGYLHWFMVLPEHRSTNIGKQLVLNGIEYLTEKGMKIVQAGVREERKEEVRLYEELGFRKVRTFSMMRRNLKSIPTKQLSPEKLEFRAMRPKTTEEDAKLLNHLYDEAFVEHFDYRPITLEEKMHMIKNDPNFDPSGCFFAYLGEKPVGYVGDWIDKKFVEHTKIRRGWVATIGVLKPYRHRGIGAALVTKALQHLRSLGMEEAVLGVDDDNPTKAKSFYETLGFQTFRQSYTYEKRLANHKNPITMNRD